MNDLTTISTDTLPALIDRAASALTGARTSAEVLEARDMARVAYDAAKSAGRMARAKDAHDAVIAAVYRAQADAAIIEARAKVRLADEYDAAQERGEVAGLGANQHREEGVADANTLGLRRDEIHDARKLRDAEVAQPGKIEAAADALIERREEPTKAALKREVIGEAEKPADPHATARKGLSSLTREGLEDEVIGLREALAEEKAKRKAAEAERDDFKAKWQEALATDDMGRALGNALRQVETLGGRLKEEMTKNARQGRRISILEAEIAKMKRERENEEITL